MKKHIPNMITCCNLISGCVAVTYALYGNLPMALAWIVIGALFDFFDGMTARLLHVSSSIGKELDSLADDVTFGVAPAAMVYHELTIMNYPAIFESLRPVLPYVAFVLAAFSALRLAKFNLDERQTTSFIGLPTPANALFWGSLLVGTGTYMEAESFAMPVIVIMLFVSCYLLVSEIPMFALKFKQWGWKGNEIRYIFLITSLLILLVFRVQGIAIVIAWYIFLSVFTTLKS
jgi:CDP-diacylglycerol--serine O-phosphatidyltransferase